MVAIRRNDTDFAKTIASHFTAVWTRLRESVRKGPVEHIKVDMDKDWLSVADICEYMGVSTFVVTSQLRSGSLPAVKFGREWRVSRRDFEDWINAQRMDSTAVADSELTP